MSPILLTRTDTRTHSHTNTHTHTHHRAPTRVKTAPDTSWSRYGNTWRPRRPRGGATGPPLPRRPLPPPPRGRCSFVTTGSRAPRPRRGDHWTYPGAPCLLGPPGCAPMALSSAHIQAHQHPPPPPPPCVRPPRCAVFGPPGHTGIASHPGTPTHLHPPPLAVGRVQVRVTALTPPRLPQ